MYKKLVESIESNLGRFAEIPELDDYSNDDIDTNKELKYWMYRVHNKELVVRVTINNSEYKFNGKWEKILARIQELWLNE